jgi:hypothetical protein
MSGSNARSAPQQREGAPKTKKEGLACSLAKSAKQSLDKVKDYKKKRESFNCGRVSHPQEFF